MAWDSATFPWDWDAESFHIAGHGSGNDFRKPVVNGRLLETELCVGKNGGFPLSSKEVSPVMQASAASSLAKHDVLRVDFHASRQINGVSRESGPATPMTCTSISKHNESNVSWHGSLNVNGSVMGNTQCMLPSTGTVGHGDGSCLPTGVLPIVTTCVGNGNGPFASFDNSSAAAHTTGKAAQRGVMNNWKKTEYGLAAGCFEQERQQPHTNLMHHAHQQIILSKEKTQFATVKVKEEKGIVSTSDSAGAQYIDEQHSSNATGSAGSGDSFTGLHLGKRTYSPDGLKATASKSAQKPALAPNKKARTGAATPRCQVEGCKLDLTTAKDYHRRHKVCEQHSKAEKVVVASAEQRFCQQCSRFHALAEFDEAKRSCRRRLAGHNERRRKPQPDPLALHARLHSGYDDWSFLQQPRFSRLPLLWQESGDCRSSEMWPCTTPLLENHSIGDYTIQGPATERQGYMKSLSQQPALSYHDKLSLLLLQSPKSVMPIGTAYLPRVHHYPFEALGGPMGDSLTLAPSSTGAGVLAGLDTTPVTRGVTRVFSDSGRALSLLSLQTRGSQAPDVLMPADPSGLANMLTLNHHQLAHNEDIAVPQHFLLQGGQHPYYNDGSAEKNMVSTSVSSSQAQSGGALVTFERDLDECAFAQDLNREACTHPLFALMPYSQDNDLSHGDHHS